MLLITSESNSKLNDFGGQKAQNLVKLKLLGYNIPRFGVISLAFDLMESKTKTWLKDEFSDLKAQIYSYFGDCKFAVRSNTEVEDGFQESKAGYFKTVLDVSLDDVEAAVWDVYNDSISKLNTLDYSKIFIIIQKFIQPQLAGVVFSRDPNGSGALVVDYTAGIGDKLVSGQTTTSTINAYTLNDFKAKIKIKPLFGLFKIARSIEVDFEYPQDIEWCLDDERLYILQSRPITTLNVKQIEAYPILDLKVVGKENFHFYKPELSEITSKPKAFILNVIYKLYQNNGPIAKTYSKFGIKYNFTDFIKIFGSDLFFDQIAEKKAFFSFRQQFSSLSNIFKFSFLKSPDPKIQFQFLSKAITKPTSSQDINQSIQEFLNVYSLIFSTNLFTTKVYQNLIRLTSKSQANKYLDLAVDIFDFSDILAYISEQNWIGNSLNIEDKSKFETFLPKIKSEINHDLENALKSEPRWKVQHLKLTIQNTKNWLQLRELSRILTVKYINHIRKTLDNQIVDKSHLYKHYKYFIDPDNFNSENENSLILKSDQFNKYNLLQWTNLITNQNIKKDSKDLISVSNGIANGEIFILTDLKNTDPATLSHKIIIVETLNPELICYFNYISGIIAVHGSVLSHLAIVARECKIPVLTNYKNSIYKLKNGDLIELDCNQSKIRLTGKTTNKD